MPQPITRLLISCACLLGCGDSPRPDVRYAELPPPATPEAMLACDPSRAQLYESQSRTTACGLWITNDCTRHTALYFGTINEERCERVADQRQFMHNADLITRAMFWRDAGCALSQSAASHDDLLAALRSDTFSALHVVITGCNQQRRYECALPRRDDSYPLRPECAPAPRADALAYALTEAEALMRAQTGCDDIAPSPLSGGARPDLGVTEIILEGCGHTFPVTCALSPDLKHTSQCEHQPPTAEALESGRAGAARAYREAASCAQSAQPAVEVATSAIEHEEGGRWRQRWRVSGCHGHAVITCHAQSLRARQMRCEAPRGLSDEEARDAALKAAARLRPGCEPSSATRWRGPGLLARMVATSDCGAEQAALQLLCDRDPRDGQPGCVIDAAREDMARQSLAAAREDFARDLSCQPQHIAATSDTFQYTNGRYERTIQLVGCKEQRAYTCHLDSDGKLSCKHR